MSFLLKNSIIILMAAYAASACASESEVTLEVIDGSIQGTFLDAGMAMAPIAVIVAGSGPTDRDGNQVGMKNDSLRLLALALAEGGVSSFRYDKRGVGASTNDLPERDLTISTFAEDLVVVLQRMRDEHPDRPLFVVGHSLGGLLGLLAASSKYVDGVVSIAGPGRKGSVITLEQLRAQAPRKLVEQAESIIADVVSGKAVDEVPTELLGLFRPSIQPFIRSWFAIDPAQVAGDLEVPVLVVQGTTDLQTTMEDACALADSGDNVSVVLVEDMNHVLRVAQGGLADQLSTYRSAGAEIHGDLAGWVTDFVHGESVGNSTCPVAFADEGESCNADSMSSDVVGQWEGTIEPIGLPQVYRFYNDEQHCLRGDFDSPAQGGFELPLSSVQVTGNQVEVSADAFGFKISGTKDGNSIRGSFTQQGQELTINLTRIED